MEFGDSISTKLYQISPSIILIKLIPMKLCKYLKRNLRSNRSLQLLYRIHLVTAGEWRQGGGLLPLDGGVELLLQQVVSVLHGGGLGHLVVPPGSLGHLFCKDGNRGRLESNLTTTSGGK